MASQNEGIAGIPSLKVVLLGDTSVGKTSIVNIVQSGEFVPDQTSTVGACFHIKRITVNGTVVKMHIWDTAGQERFRSLAPMYYRDAQYAVLVYSITSSESFDAIDRWYNGLKTDCAEMPGVILVGNKTDLEDSRTVSSEAGANMAQKIGADFLETSAKTDHDKLTEMFENIAVKFIESQKAIPVNNNTPIEPANGNKEGCKC